MKKEICIENGMVFTSCGLEEYLTENQKMIINNIETGANIVFDCYRQCGFTTVILNLLAYYFKYKIGNFCLVLNNHNHLVEDKEKIKKILSFYGIEYTEYKEDSEKNKSTYNQYKIYSMNGSSSITLTTCNYFDCGKRYEKVFIDNAAFMENNVLRKVYSYDENVCSKQIIAGSCHANLWLSERYKLGESDFNFVIQDIEEKKEPPYNWFHVYVRWWNDQKYKDIIKGQTKAKFLTPEICGYLFKNKRKFAVRSIENMKELLGKEGFETEMNYNQEYHE